MRVFYLNIETLKQISDPTALPKMAQYSPKGKKLIGRKNASWRNTMRRPKNSLLTLPRPQIAHIQRQNALNDPKIGYH